MSLKKKKKEKYHKMNKSQLTEIKIRGISNNFKNIISREWIDNDDEIKWGNNGIGDRWLNKKFIYIVIYSNGKQNENLFNKDTTIDENFTTIKKSFIDSRREKKMGIIGIYIVSTNDTKKNTRPISDEIRNIITKRRCVICGTKKTLPDHKNDFYNDYRVLDKTTQNIDDFQALCRHCNLQKREVCKKEKKNKKLYSITKIPQFENIVAPWEKKAYDEKDIFNKVDIYWYDPQEFMRKLEQYNKYVVPILFFIRKL